MAETGAIRAGGAFVEIFSKDAALMKGLNASAAKFKAWGQAITDIGKKVAAAGAAATAVLLGTLKVFSDQGDSIAKMSQRTGIGVEALSELRYAAEQSAVTVEQLEQSIRFLQKQGGDASLEGLLKIADELVAIEDPGKRAARAMELFGKSGTAMIPMMIDGSRGMRDLMQRARDLGLTMSHDAAFGAVEFGDNVADVWKQVKKATFEIGASLAPALADLIGWLQKSLAGLIAWVKQNREIVVLALKVALGVTAAGVALVGLGLAMKTAGVAMGFLASATIVLGAAMAAAKAAVLFLLTPVGAVAAAVTSLAVVAVAKSGVIGEALAWLGGMFKSLGEDAGLALDGIKNALAAGDIGKAAAVFWSFLKLEWEKGLAALSNFWFAFKQGFLQSWSETVAGFAKLFVSAVGIIKIAWAKASEFISSFVQGWITNASEGIVELQRLAGIMTDAQANRAAVQIHSKGERRQQEIAEESRRARDAAARGVQEQFKMLDDEVKAAEKDRVDAMNARLQQSTEELDAARAAFKSAVEDARNANNNAASTTKKKLSDVGLFSPGEEGLIGELKGLSTKGIFNPRALQSLEGSREKQARAIKPIEKAIEKLVGEQGEAVDILRRIERNTDEGMAFT